MSPLPLVGLTWLPRQRYFLCNAPLLCVFQASRSVTENPCISFIRRNIRINASSAFACDPLDCDAFDPMTCRPFLRGPEGGPSTPHGREGSPNLPAGGSLGPRGIDPAISTGRGEYRASPGHALLLHRIDQSVVRSFVVALLLGVVGVLVLSVAREKYRWRARG
eukprot:3774049-Pyramimonas_sp.AAC.1